MVTPFEKSPSTTQDTGAGIDINPGAMCAGSPVVESFSQSQPLKELEKGRPGEADPEPADKRVYRRERDRLTEAERLNFFAAVRHAFEIGYPITHALTIEFDRLAGEGSKSYPDSADVAKATAKLIRLLGRWYDRQGLLRVFAWGRENALTGGEHIHLALHLPPQLADKFIAWAAKHFDAKKGPRLLRPGLKGVAANSRNGGWLLQHNFRGLDGALDWTAYVTKGVDGSQGMTKGKRVGMGNVLNKTARNQFSVAKAT